MDFRISITIFAPLLEQKYDVLVPIDRKVNDIVLLMKKAIKDFSADYYSGNVPNIYNKTTGTMYNLNSTIKETDIRTGSRLLLI